jgi:hypothetical protein
MRGFLLSNLVIFAMACGGTPQNAKEPSGTAQDARRSAERGGPVGATPEAGTASAPTVACGDTVLNDQVSSGGQQLTHQVPCSTIDTPNAPIKPARILDDESREPVPNPPPAPTPADDPPPPKKKGPAIQAPTK